MKADPYLTCSNCTHDKKEHRIVFGPLGRKLRPCNFDGCTCPRFQPIRRKFVDEYDPIKDKIVRKISED